MSREAIERVVSKHDICPKTGIYLNLLPVCKERGHLWGSQMVTNNKQQVAKIAETCMRCGSRRHKSLWMGPHPIGKGN